MSKKVVFLGMGGTIAGQAQSATDNVGYKSAQVGVAQLLQAVPALKDALGGRVLVSEQVAQVDSKDMEFAHWTLLAQRVVHHLALPAVDGVVITHGTDTLEETAYFLSRVVPAALLAAKPVVLTCAMRPASALVPDGPQNLLDATAVACTAGAHGVLVVCAGSIHGARDVQKVHPYRLDAFDSGDAGPLGVVEEGTVRLMHGWPAVEARTGPNLDSLAAQPWPRVEIVMNYAGATGATVCALCAAPADGSAAVRGLVVAGTGNGTIHKDLEAALLQAQAQGVHVVRTTRCARGQVVPGSVRGFAFADSQGLSPVKARIAVMLELMA